MADAADTPSEPLGVEEVVPTLGSDPWLRFDMWASRSWDMSQQAVSLAKELGPRSEESVDERIIAMFHASSIASKFAEITNPLSDLENGPPAFKIVDGDQAELIARLFDTGEE